VVTPLLELAGVKSWTAFVQSSSCVELALDGDTVTLTPARNLGAADGFEADTARISTAKANPEALGRAIRPVLGESGK